MKKRKALLKQKLCGLLLIITGILSAMIDGDITFMVFILPIGLYTLFSKELFMML